MPCILLSQLRVEGCDATVFKSQINTLNIIGTNYRVPNVHAHNTMHTSAKSGSMPKLLKHCRINLVARVTCLLHTFAFTML